MNASIRPARPHSVGSSSQARRGPPALLVAAGGALLVVLALSVFTLSHRHVPTVARDSAASDEGMRLENTTPTSEREPEPPQPDEPARPSAVEPARADAGAPNGCEDSSLRFREIVATCFDSQALCNVGVSVRFDGLGQPIDVAFLSEVSPSIAERAREARACVARRFNELATPCSKSTSVHYTQRCTVR